MSIGATYTDWYIGFSLSFFVIVVVVIIVAIILTLAARIADQARTAAAGVDVVRAQTTSLDRGVELRQRLCGPDPSHGPVPRGRSRWANELAAFDTHALWQIAVGMGAVVLIVVVILLMLLLSFVIDIQRSVALAPRDGADRSTAHVQDPAAGIDAGGAEPRHRGGHHSGRLHERPHGRLHGSRVSRYE